MILPSNRSILSILLVVYGTPSSASAAPVTCTKSKNNGGILLYGNADWIGGWTEVYADPDYVARRRDRGLLRAFSFSSNGKGRDLAVEAGATFGLMFEMDRWTATRAPPARRAGRSTSTS